MPRNTLKSFPTARLRRGLAHVHPLCAAPLAPPVEPRDPRPPRSEDPVTGNGPEPNGPWAVAPASDPSALVSVGDSAA